MKITIEIDTGDVPAVTTSIVGATSSSESPPDAAAEILARARALGARSGGAAPATPPRAGAPPVPAAITGSTAAVPVSGGGAVSAGAAPGAPRVPSQTVEQDPEAPSAADAEH
jgi:hypothetical protein